MYEILALAAKDLRLLLRDRAGFFVTFVFPLAYAVFFGIILGNRDGLGAIKVTVIDLAGGPRAQSLVEKLTASTKLRVSLSGPEHGPSKNQPEDSIATITIPAGFGLTTKAREQGAEPSVQLLVVPARPAELAMIEGLLNKYVYEVLSTSSAGPAAPIVQTQIGLPDGRHGMITPRNQYAVAFPQGIIWGVLGCTAAFSLSIVVERVRGTLFRLQAAPIGRARILAGKAGACMLTTFALTTVLFGVAVGFFGVRPNSYPLLACAVISVSIGFVGIMMMLSVLGRTEQAASGITWTVLLAMAMVGGGMVPHFVMPIWLQQLGAYSPVRWAIAAMEGAVWRYDHVTDVLRPCGKLLVCGVVCFLLGARAFRWSARQT